MKGLPVQRLTIIAFCVALMAGCSRTPTDPRDTGADKAEKLSPKPRMPEPNPVQSATGRPKSEAIKPVKAEVESALTSGLPQIEPVASFQVPGKPRPGRPPLLSDDGKILAIDVTTDEFKVVTQIWDLKAKKLVAEFPDFLRALSPSGGRVLVNLTVFDVTTQKPLGESKIGMTHAAFRDEDRVVSSNRSYSSPKPQEGKVVQWDVTKNADAGSFAIPDADFSDLFLAKDGRELWLFMGNKKFEIECYDLDAKSASRTIRPEPINEKKGYFNCGYYLGVGRDGSAFSSANVVQRIFDGETGKIIGTLPTDIAGCERSFFPTRPIVLARPTGPDAAELPYDRRDLIVYDWKARKALVVLSGGDPKLGKFTGSTVAVSADGKTVAHLDPGGRVLVFDVSSVK